MAFFVDPQVNATHAAQEFVQRWAEAVLRQAARTREVRKRTAEDEWAYERDEDPSLDRSPPCPALPPRTSSTAAATSSSKNAQETNQLLTGWLASLST